MVLHSVRSYENNFTNYYCIHIAMQHPIPTTSVVAVDAATSAEAAATGPASITSIVDKFKSQLKSWSFYHHFYIQTYIVAMNVPMR